MGLLVGGFQSGAFDTVGLYDGRTDGFLDTPGGRDGYRVGFCAVVLHKIWTASRYTKILQHAHDFMIGIFQGEIAETLCRALILYNART